MCSLATIQVRERNATNDVLKGSATPKNPVQDFKFLRFLKISSNYGKISEHLKS